MPLMFAELYFCCCSFYRWIEMNKRTNERTNEYLKNINLHLNNYHHHIESYLTIIVVIKIYSYLKMYTF